MIDTHTHLNFPELTSRLEEVLAAAKEVGVDRFVIPGTTAETSTSAVSLGELYGCIYAGVGIHPLYAHEYSEVDRARLEELLQGINSIVSIGEVGLDYYHFEGLMVIK